MAIKKKTHLNLSGSHHTLDSDNGFVGGTLYLTGAVSASTDVSAQRNLYVQGSEQVTGSIFVRGAVSASQGIFTQLTGSLSGTAAGLPFLVNGGNMTDVKYNASTGQWEITGSAGTSVAGVNTQVQFNADGVHGVSSLLTFNTASVGSKAANTLTFPSGAVGFLSGSDITNQAYTLPLSAAAAGIPPMKGGPFPNFFDPALVVKTPVLMTQSLMLFDGRHDPLGLGNSNLPGGGVILTNDSQLTVFTGSWSPLPTANGGASDPVITIGISQNTGFISTFDTNVVFQSSSNDQENVFSVRPSTTPGQMLLNQVGDALFLSGAVRLSNGATFTVYSGSETGGGSFRIQGGQNPKTVDVNIFSGSNLIFDSGLNDPQFVGINVRPLFVTMSTNGTSGIALSGSLLANDLQNQSVGKLDFNVIAASAGDNYASFTFSATVRKNISGVTSVISYTELDSALEGAAATDPWDVNINSDGTIYCTGSAGTVHWYAQVTKKMVLSGSGMILY